MAKIPMKFDSRSERLREVTVVVFVDGKEYTQTTQHVKEWAIGQVIHTALTQVEDPDYDAAADAQAAMADRQIAKGF
jgi:hypothetical protein